MTDDQRFTVDRYLDQVKILTVLATTLLVTPNLLLTILQEEAIRARLDALFPAWRNALLFTNISFVLAVLATYFIYSSLVGSLHEGRPDIYRTATRVFSIAQFALVVAGCIGLLVLFRNAI